MISLFSVVKFTREFVASALYAKSLRGILEVCGRVCESHSCKQYVTQMLLIVKSCMNYEQCRLGYTRTELQPSH